MKLIIYDKVGENGYVDVTFEPSEIVLLIAKNVQEKLIKQLGFESMLDYLAELGADINLITLLSKLYSDNKIKNVWDLSYYTSTFYGHDQDAMLIRNLQKVELENNVDLYELFTQLENVKGGKDAD